MVCKYCCYRLDNGMPGIKITDSDADCVINTL